MPQVGWYEPRLSTGYIATKEKGVVTGGSLTRTTPKTPLATPSDPSCHRVGWQPSRCKEAYRAPILISCRLFESTVRLYHSISPLFTLRYLRLFFRLFLLSRLSDLNPTFFKTFRYFLLVLRFDFFPCVNIIPQCLFFLMYLSNI